jgi:hypothetical protein
MSAMKPSRATQHDADELFSVIHQIDHDDEITAEGRMILVRLHEKLKALALSENTLIPSGAELAMRDAPSIAEHMRREYLRGLEDAARRCDVMAECRYEHARAPFKLCASAIRALKEPK